MLEAFDEFADERISTLELAVNAVAVKDLIEKLLDVFDDDERITALIQELKTAIQAHAIECYKLGFRDGVKSFDE